MSNDFAVFRLADIILMKAEAPYRNQDGVRALAVINQRVSGIYPKSGGDARFHLGRIEFGWPAERSALELVRKAGAGTT